MSKQKLKQYDDSDSEDGLDFNEDFFPSDLASNLRVGDSFDIGTPRTIDSHKRRKANGIIEQLKKIVTPNSNSLYRFHSGTEQGTQSYARQKGQHINAQKYTEEELEKLMQQHATKNAKYEQDLYSPFVSTTEKLPALINNTMRRGGGGDLNLRYNVLGKAPIIERFSDIPQQYRSNIPARLLKNNTNPEIEKEILYNDSYTPLHQYSKGRYDNPLLNQIENPLTTKSFDPNNNGNYLKNVKIVRQYINEKNKFPTNEIFSPERRQQFKSFRDYGNFLKQNIADGNPLLNYNYQDYNNNSLDNEPIEFPFNDAHPNLSSPDNDYKFKSQLAKHAQGGRVAKSQQKYAHGGRVKDADIMDFIEANKKRRSQPRMPNLHHDAVKRGFTIASSNPKEINRLLELTANGTSKEFNDYLLSIGMNQVSRKKPKNVLDKLLQELETQRF